MSNPSFTARRAYDGAAIETALRDAARPARVAAALLAALAGCAGCLKVEPTDGALACAPAPYVCPPGYQCAADQRCWRHPASLGDGGSGDDAAVDVGDLATSSGDAAAPAGDLALPVYVACPSGALFCDGFESGNIATRWTSTFVSPAGAGQTLAIGAAQVYAGSLALHGASSYASDSWSLAQYNWSGVTAPLTLRLWVRPVSALVSRGMVARVLDHGDTHGFQIGGSPGGNWTISENLGTDHDSTTAVATGVWTCLELVIPTSGEVQLFVNGAGTPAVHFTPLSPGELYDELHVGVEWAPANVPVDVWVDDVAMATTRLPCP
jgi:hypothetical protein